MDSKQFARTLVDRMLEQRQHKMQTPKPPGWHYWPGEPKDNSDVRMDAEYLAEDNCLVVGIEGTYKMLESDTRHMKKYMGYCRDNKVQKLFADLRRGDFKTSMVAAFNRFDKYEKNNISQRMQLGWLVNEISEEAEFYQLCASNRGWPIRFFTELGDLKNWLKIEGR